MPYMHIYVSSVWMRYYFMHILIYENTRWIVMRVGHGSTLKGLNGI